MQFSLQRANFRNSNHNPQVGAFSEKEKNKWTSLAAACSVKRQKKLWENKWKKQNMLLIQSPFFDGWEWKRPQSRNCSNKLFNYECLFPDSNLENNRGSSAHCANTCSQLQPAEVLMKVIKKRRKNKKKWVTTGWPTRTENPLITSSTTKVLGQFAIDWTKWKMS